MFSIRRNYIDAASSRPQFARRRPGAGSLIKSVLQDMLEGASLIQLLPHRKICVGVPFRRTLLKRCLMAVTTACSARCENSSTGVTPLTIAIQSVAKRRQRVNAIFGHELSCHCPCQTQVPRVLNGKRYGIGHAYPSGPREPTRSSNKCTWKLTNARPARDHLRESPNTNSETINAKRSVCRSWWYSENQGKGCFDPRVSSSGMIPSPSTSGTTQAKLATARLRRSRPAALESTHPVKKCVIGLIESFFLMKKRGDSKFLQTTDHSTIPLLPWKALIPEDHDLGLINAEFVVNIECGKVMSRRTERHGDGNLPAEKKNPFGESGRDSITVPSRQVADSAHSK
jgi:hypothetical protein